MDTQAMGLEESIMAEQLHYIIVNFLPSIPDDKETEIVQRFVNEAHALFSKVTLSEEEIFTLLKSWFTKGQKYEGNTVSIPADIERVLNNLMVCEIKRYSVSFLSDMDCLCRIIWAWFQRGRAFERGNASDTAFLPQGKYLSD